MAYKRRTKLVILDSLRGSGTVRAGEREYPVAYELDRYKAGAEVKADGSVSGDLSGLADWDEGAPVALALEDGLRLTVLLSNIDHEGADLEASAPAQPAS